MPEDNPTTENGSDGGTGESHLDNGSTAGQSSNAAGLTLDALAKEVKDLSGLVRKVQSTSDKSSNQLKQHEQVIAEYRALLAKGLSPEAAEAELGKAIEQRGVDDRLSRMEKNINLLLEQGGITTTNPGAVAMVTKYNLDPNSPEVTRILQSGKEGEALRADLAELALSKASRPTAAPGAAPVQNSATAAPGNLSDLEVSQKLDKLNQMYKNPTKFAAEIAKAEAELDNYMPK